MAIRGPEGDIKDPTDDDNRVDRDRKGAAESDEHRPQLVWSQATDLGVRYSDNGKVNLSSNRSLP